MSEVKRIEAMGTLRELKLFSFENNHDFRQGTVGGVEMQKAFVFPTKPVIDRDGNQHIPYQKTITGFRAGRMGKHRNHVMYDYSLYATSERSILHIPLPIMEKILSTEDESDTISEIDHIDFEDGELSESTTVSFNMADDEPRQINVSHSYEVAVDDNVVFEHSDNDIFYDIAGDMIHMPGVESRFGEEQRFVPEPIEHERLPIDEHLQSEIAFRAILDPYFYKEYAAVISFRDATERMRAIMNVMRTGADVKRLYDEVE